jgi:hypothetical protein
VEAVASHVGRRGRAAVTALQSAVIPSRTMPVIGPVRQPSFPTDIRASLDSDSVLVMSLRFPPVSSASQNVYVVDYLQR